MAHHPGAEVVRYCSCPDDVSGVRAALRPLESGFPDWRELGYPVETK